MDIVSIIIPVYNVNDYLKECLQSVVTQTYENIEVLLIDDGSTDGSDTICDEFAQKDSRVKVVHKTNEGVSVARNLGIQLCTGKYVLFVDSDDWIEDNYVSDLLAECNEEDYDLVICNYNKVYSHKKQTRPVILKDEIKEFTGEFFHDFYYLRNLLNFPVIKLYKRDVIIENQIHFPEDFSDAEDQVFNFYYFKHVKKYQYIEKFMYNYRHRMGSLSKNTSIKSFECNVRKLKIQKQFLDENNIFNRNLIVLEAALRIIQKYSCTFGREFSGFTHLVSIVRKIVGIINSNTIPVFSKKWFALQLLNNDCVIVLYVYYRLKDLVK